MALWKRGAQKISQERHKALEASEVQADDGGVFQAHFLHGKTLADRDGKGVHGKPDGDEKQFRD